MKATLSKSGVLTISAESSLEEYALKKWSEDNFGTKEKCENLWNSLIIDTNSILPDDLPF